MNAERTLTDTERTGPRNPTADDGSASNTGSAVLRVDDLHTQFRTPDGIVRAVDGVSFTVDEGEIVGIVGESGCGKSVTARSIVGLQDPGEITRGSITIEGTDIVSASDRRLRQLRGDAVSMIFQNPTETLNPVFDVGEQIAESLAVHDRRGSRSQGLLEFLQVPPFARRSEWDGYREQAVDLLEEVGIATPQDRVDAYPHELSGGQCQRACIAIALASDPQLLIADEPTTALDATTQAQLLERLRRYNETRETSILLITHDFGVVAELCDRVVVMYDGQVMETGPTDRILDEPTHPYTRALLECLPQRVPRDRRLPTIEGTVPESTGEPTGCPFAPRCVHARTECRESAIPTIDLGDERGRVACVDPEAGCPSKEATDGTETTRSATTGRDGTASRRDERGRGRQGETTEPGDERPKAGVTDETARRTGAADGGELAVELEGVSKRYSLADGTLDRLLGTTDSLAAVRDVDLSIRPTETVALVGESGCGKSTLAHLVTGLDSPSEGDVRLAGQSVGPAGERSPAQLADVGVVFQDPRSSLDPQLSVERTIAEPLCAHEWDRERREARVRELLERVGLAEHHATSYPHELSGGQVQRVAIARALALDPQLVVLDEPVSALDVSVQARILNLLADLQADLELTYLLVSHDLGVVEHVADRVAVMYLGELVEVGPVDRVFERPSHPYTEGLLAAIPSVDGEEAGNGGSDGTLSGTVPSPIDPPSGCSFRTRCPRAEPECADANPDYRRDGGVRSKCHFPDNDQ
ncbi:dipeptide ABC transporter ATP-binding protein [Halobiforma nitratireducens]|uniref:Nickel import system ATP-binding protein NikD n=1 Tax=Halobiforma nitratireducens JCM 10879 TaxID=1227454 RepID=M0MK73_9EURY|nr:ABC transporter ATP-binding protein [Halobiforma nitratireducens]EMA45134.1 oligopeptide/dipeptide ABC transporter, ATPase subunit [Halobiforma nitratireducens JCM 10879]